MPKISDDVVRAVTEAARIEDVVGDFVTLRKSGVNMTGICPFHDDKNDGNFIVRPSTIKNKGNTYRCFVCDAKGGPVQFLMNAERMSFPDAIRYLGKKYCIEVDDIPVNWTPPPPRPIPPPPPLMDPFPRELVKSTIAAATDKNVFVYWLQHLPWSEVQRARLQHTLWEYCVGGWNDGRVVFWLIDHKGKPCTAKLMKFYPMGHPKFGHRDKESHPGWIHNQQGLRDTYKPNEHEVEKPLFGAHLLKRYPKAVVNVVESEKTAIVMANYYGHSEQQLWLACGGLKHLQLEAMQPLIDQGRKVWLWPDKDGMKEWQELCEKLGSDKVRIYTRFFETCWTDEDGDKADCADITIRLMAGGEKPKPKVDSHKVAQEPQAVLPLDMAVVPWNSEEPFLDPIEMTDMRVREWREILRQRYNFASKRRQQ